MSKGSLTMDASARAIAAYGQAQKGAATDRGIEYQVFARITAALAAADRKGKTGFADLAQALHENRQLWDAVAIDLVDDGNALQADLRAGLLSLAIFVRQHGEKVLHGEASVQAIVDVNQAIMNGLRGMAPGPGAVAREGDRP
mgnify:CR=1 FL=1